MASKKRTNQTLTVKHRYADGSIWFERIVRKSGAGRRNLEGGRTGLGLQNRDSVAPGERNLSESMVQLTAGHFGGNEERVAENGRDLGGAVLKQDGLFCQRSVGRDFTMNVKAFDHKDYHLSR